MGNQLPGIRTALARCGWLVAVTLGLGLLLAFPARAIGGPAALEGLTYAALLCVVPGCLVFLVVPLFSSAGTPAPFIILAGTGLRMLSVLVGILAIQALRPDLGFKEFVVWVLAFYLALLAIETWLVLRSAADESASSVQGPPA
jgi:hypothetical protein